MKLIWSPIQLRLANQCKIVPNGRLTRVTVSIDGVCGLADLELIEIVDGSNPYPTLLGLDWAFDNQNIIDLNKIQMIFKVEDLKVIVSLDPSEGIRYVEPGKGKEIDNLHTMNVWMENYVNPTNDGVLNWRSIFSCASDSEESLQN
jgi:hypothetical protein